VVAKYSSYGDAFEYESNGIHFVQGKLHIIVPIVGESMNLCKINGRNFHLIYYFIHSGLLEKLEGIFI
jgi:hypothetical protein